MSRADESSTQAQQDRLAEQYTQIAQLAGGLAHEIKNPLSTIRLNMELLAEDFQDNPSPRERRALQKIEVVERECQRLQDLLEDYLNFTKIRHVDLRPTNVNRLIEDILDFYAPQADEAEIDVLRYLESDLPHVPLDRESMRGALLNLILNAQQAMPDGGQLVVRTRDRGQHIAVQLIDTGCGMDETTGAKIFDPFYSTKPGGTGLGLPTACKIIEAHGGRISIQSELGLGTQFTVELPIPARLTGAETDLPVG